MTKLIFSGEDAASKYEICYQAVVLSDRQVQISEWDTVVDLLRKLKAVGNVAKEKTAGTELYELASSNGGMVFPAVDLEKSELKLLIEFIERPIWRPSGLERVLNTRKWLKELQDAK